MERDWQFVKYVDGASIGVREGNFVTTVDGVEVPAEIGEKGPETGAFVYYDSQGIPTRAVFLEEIR